MAPAVTLKSFYPTGLLLAAKTSLLEPIVMFSGLENRERFPLLSPKGEYAPPSFQMISFL